MQTSYLKIIKHEWRTIFLITFITVILSLVLSLIQPLQYSSSIRLLIISKASAAADPYTAIKSAERIGDNLAQIVYTTDFFDKVMKAGKDIDQSVFKKEEYKKRNQWAKMVQTEVARGTGMLQVTVYHKDKEEATKIAQAISGVLTEVGWEYIGGDLDIKLVDTPLQSRWPVKPNFILNTCMGLVLGLLLGVSFSLLAFSSRHKEQESGENRGV